MREREEEYALAKSVDQEAEEEVVMACSEIRFEQAGGMS